MNRGLLNTHRELTSLINSDNISDFIGDVPLFGFQIRYNEYRVIDYTQGASLLNKFHFYRKFYGSCKNNFEIR